MPYNKLESNNCSINLENISSTLLVMNCLLWKKKNRKIGVVQDFRYDAYIPDVIKEINRSKYYFNIFY